MANRVAFFFVKMCKCFALSLYQMKPGLSEGNLLKIVNSTQFKINSNRQNDDLGLSGKDLIISKQKSLNGL